MPAVAGSILDAIGPPPGFNYLAGDLFKWRQERL
jgi:hypothetical protein